MDNKIKVAQFTDAYYPVVDGVVSVVDNYTKQINKENECSVCAPSFSKKSNYKDDGKIKVIRCKSVKAPEGYRSALPFTDFKFNKQVLDGKYDIFHVHSPFFIGRKALKLAKKQGIPVVATLHTQYHQDFERVLGKHNPLVKFMLRFIIKVYNKADSVWTVSETSVKYLRQYGYKGEVKVIRNATDFVYPENAQELISKIDELHNLKGQKNVFIFVGRMAMYKNLKLICDALKILNDNGEDFKMLFVGGGFDYDELVEYACKLGLKDKCIFTGNVKDKTLLQAYYLRSDLLLFPSTFDTSGIAQMEAFAHKTPSIAIKGSCSGEQIQDAVNGFLCEESATDFADKLQKLCANPELVKQAGENAYKTLYRTWDDLGKEVLQAYKQVIKDYKQKKNKNK